MMEKFSLYDDDRTTISSDSTAAFKINQDRTSIVEVDLSSNETLYTMSKKIRDILVDKPDSFNLTVYLVCGNTCSKDAKLFAEYLEDVTQPLSIVFRGVIHFDFIQLFLNNKVYVTDKCSIVYSKDKLHDTMKNFLIKPDAFKKFMQRFIDEYWKLNEGNLLPVEELKHLGIVVESL